MRTYKGAGMEGGDKVEIGVFESDLAIGHVVFVVATRPLRKLEADFGQFEINGLPYPLNTPARLQNDQGLWVDVGGFESGTEIEVRWKFRTGILVPEDEVVIGHCPNYRLTKLVRLERKMLEPFTDYEGVFRVRPERL